MCVCVCVWAVANVKKKKTRVQRKAVVDVQTQTPPAALYTYIPTVIPPNRAARTAPPSPPFPSGCHHTHTRTTSAAGFEFVTGTGEQLSEGAVRHFALFHLL